MNAPAKVPNLAKNYRLVHDIVLEQGPGVHLTMGDVHELARRRKRSIGFTTVYRALTRLRDLGLVSEIVLPGAGSAYYEVVADTHAHFRCDSCGKVDDVDYVPPRRSVLELSRRYGIEVRETLLSLHGLCKACLAAKIEA
ncbi:MAG: Fur family transcriptional regulator [Candidatus Tumulicola sp.]